MAMHANTMYGKTYNGQEFGAMATVGASGVWEDYDYYKRREGREGELWLCGSSSKEARTLLAIAIP